MCVTPLVMQYDSASDVTGKLSRKVPCGKCPKCRKVKVAQWAYRFDYELRRSTNPLFVTLTYSDDYLPLVYDDKTSQEVPTLCRRDIQLFMKKLRKSSGVKGIKYLCVGEYSPKKQRPHYHLVLLNLPDAKLINSNWNYGFTYSPTLSDGGLFYVLKYMNKEFVWSNDDLRERPRLQVSKGIGANYLTPEVVRYHNQSPEFSHMINLKGQKIPLPRYYKTKIYDADMYANVSNFMQKLSIQLEIDKIRRFKRKFPTYSDDEILNLLSLRNINVRHLIRNESIDDTQLDEIASMFSNVL